MPYRLSSQYLEINLVRKITAVCVCLQLGFSGLLFAEEFPSPPQQPIPPSYPYTPPSAKWNALKPSFDAPPTYPNYRNSRSQRLMHLLQAADHLEAAGLKEMAVKVRQQAECEKAAESRQQLQQTLSQIKRLQAEADRIKQELARHDGNRTRVRIDVKIIEISQAEFDKLGIAKIGTDIEQANGTVAPAAVNSPWKTDGKLKGVAFRSLDEKEHATFEKILKSTKARIVSQPTIMTLNGQRAEVAVGQEIPITIPAADGKIQIEFLTRGTRLSVTPHSDDNGKLRMQISWRHSTVDLKKGIQQAGLLAPQLKTSAVNTNVVIDSTKSQAVIIGGLKHGKNVQLLVLAPTVFAGCRCETGNVSHGNTIRYQSTTSPDNTRPVYDALPARSEPAKSSSFPIPVPVPLPRPGTQDKIRVPGILPSPPQPSTSQRSS